MGEKRKYDLDSVKDKELDFINISIIKLVYKISALFHIVVAVACVCCTIYLVVKDLILYALLTLIGGLLIIYVSWLIFKIIIGLIYDIKLIKYKILYPNSASNIQEEMITEEDQE